MLLSLSKIQRVVNLVRFKTLRLIEIVKNRGILHGIYRVWKFILLTIHRLHMKYIRAIYDREARDLIFWNENYRYDYDLPEDATIFDLGGYRGEFTERLLNEHSVEIVHVFEPVPKFSQDLREKFSDDSDVMIHEYGLMDSNTRVEFSTKGASSTMYDEDTDTEVEIRDIVDAIDNLDIQEIQLMKINIEGAEYALIERLIESGYIKRIQNIQIQFHDRPDIEDCKQKQADIQEELGKTHELKFEFYFVWESWTRKSTR